MGYSFYIASTTKPISLDDFQYVITNLSKFNKNGLHGEMACDFFLEGQGYLTVAGSFGISGKYAEGFVLNVVVLLINLGHIPKVLSHDWEYGTKEEWEWFDSIRNPQG